MESLNPSGISCGFKTTADATTGPAKGPRPASSTPAMTLEFNCPQLPFALNIDDTGMEVSLSIVKLLRGLLQERPGKPGQTVL